MSLVAGMVVMALVVSLTGWLGSWQATWATGGVAWFMVNGFHRATQQTPRGEQHG